MIGTKRVPAEHTHLQGLDTKSRSDRAVLDVGAEAAVCQDGSVDGEQYVHSRQHDQIEDCRGKNCYTFFLLGHAERNCQGEDQSQVAEHCVACAVEQLEEHVQNIAFMQNSRQSVSSDCRRICEGAAYAEQNTCGRQYCDRQKQRLTDLLGDRKCLRSAVTFVFCHSFSLSFKTVQWLTVTLIGYDMKTFSIHRFFSIIIISL